MRYFVLFMLGCGDVTQPVDAGDDAAIRFASAYCETDAGMFLADDQTCTPGTACTSDGGVGTCR
jgi:hypothetical protein